MISQFGVVVCFSFVVFHLAGYRLCSSSVHSVPQLALCMSLWDGWIPSGVDTPSVVLVAGLHVAGMASVIQYY
jgi:hypothetical protein